MGYIQTVGGTHGRGQGPGLRSLPPTPILQLLTSKLGPNTK